MSHADIDSPTARAAAAQLFRLKRSIALIARYNAEVTRTYLRDHGLSEPMVAALWELREPLSLTELARRMRCQKQNITQIADKLEEQGLVRRTAHPTDRRVTLLTLTEAGRMERGLLGEHLLNDFPLAVLTVQDLTRLEASLEKVTSEIS